MQEEQTLPEPEEQTRRFGPVTWLALMGGTVFGLIGVLIANIFFSGQILIRGDAPRAILVISVMLGAGIGIVAGVLAESGWHVKLRDRLALTDASWFYSITIAVIVGAGVLSLMGLLLSIGLSSRGSPMTAWAVTFNYLFSQLPKAVIWLVGLAVALRNWSRHPRASFWAVLGLAGFALAAVLGLFISFGSYALAVRFSPTNQVRTMQIIAACGMFLISTINAISFAFLLAAVFVSRNSSESSPHRDLDLSESDARSKYGKSEVHDDRQDGVENSYSERGSLGTNQH